MQMKILKSFSEQRFEDSRGQNVIKFEDLDSEISLKQSNTKEGVFRGLHIQLPDFPQTKYINVLKGEITDFVVSLDKSRDDFGKIYSYKMNSSGGFIKVPPFFAHGFLTHSQTIFQYVCLGKYKESKEITILYPSKELYKNQVSQKDLLGIKMDQALEMFSKISWR